MDKNELRIAVCEDFEPDKKLLTSCIRNTGVPVKCDTYESGEALLNKFTSGMYHLIYLDIYMDSLTGMDAAAVIRKIDRTVMLVFTTKSREHAFEANKYRSLLYIEKPVSQETVNYTLMVASALRDKLKNEVLTVPTSKKRVDIRHNDLIYAEVLNQRCVLHLKGERVIEVSTDVNIDDLEKLLPQPRFCRTHRSYIVNLDYVDRSNGSDFIMEGGDVAYVTQKEYRRIMKQYDNWLFGQAREEKL